MKKLILLTGAMVIIGSSALCQVKTSANAPQDKITYLAKTQQQKIAAWICLGTGAALVTTAAIISATRTSEDVVSIYTLSSEPRHNYTSETVLFVIGGAAMLTSIPLFIGASHNRQKARLTITEQKTAIGLPIAAPKKIPSLTLVISI